jgi:thrombospondin 2/3/4/5
MVSLDPIGSSQIDPIWLIRNDGAEIHQISNSDPGLAIGYDSLNGMDFDGTLYVDTDLDDDYIGIIFRYESFLFAFAPSFDELRFSYQSNKRFYVVAWKKGPQAYWEEEPFVAMGETGIQIKVVESETGPGQMLRNALWHSGDIKAQV